VGTVFVGISGPGVDRAERLDLPGDRAAIRAATVRHAIDTLATQISFPGNA